MNTLAVLVVSFTTTALVTQGTRWRPRPGAFDAQIAESWDVPVLKWRNDHMPLGGDRIRSIDQRPDGKQWLVVYGDSLRGLAGRGVALWTADRGRFALCTREFGRGISTARYSRDGTRVLIATDPSDATHIQLAGELRVLDSSLQTLRKWDVEDSGVDAAEFTRDGQSIIASLGDGVWIQDAVTGSRKMYFCPVLRQTWLEFSPDGAQLLARDFYSSFSLRRAGTAVLEHVYRNTGITCARYAPDGRYVVIGHSYAVTLDPCQVLAVTLLDPQSGRVVARYRMPGPGVDDVTVSPNGALLAVANCRMANSRTDFRREVTVLALPTGRRLGVLPPGTVGPVRFSADGRFLATGSRAGGVVLWEIPR